MAQVSPRANGTAAPPDVPGEHEPQDDDSEGTDSIVRLPRTLGLFNGIMQLSGTVIGSGIFVSPKGVIQEVGSVGLSLIIWVACGIYALIGAHCFAELGTLGTHIRKSGGVYNYIQESFGDLPAFAFVWASLLVILPAANAAIAITFADYALYPFFPDCGAPVVANRLLAAVAIGMTDIV